MFLELALWLCFTLKAFANSSPRFALKPWVLTFNGRRSQPSQGCALQRNWAPDPGLPEHNHWAEISQRFQRKNRAPHSLQLNKL